MDWRFPIAIGSLAFALAYAGWQQFMVSRASITDQVSVARLGYVVSVGSCVSGLALTVGISLWRMRRAGRRECARQVRRLQIELGDYECSLMEVGPAPDLGYYCRDRREAIHEIVADYRKLFQEVRTTGSGDQGLGHVLNRIFRLLDVLHGQVNAHLDQKFPDADRERARKALADALVVVRKLRQKLEGILQESVR